MKQISSFQFIQPPKSKYSSKRQEIISDIISTINKGREGTDFNEVTFAQINGMLRDTKGWDLDIFYSQFKEAKHPSSFFFWKLKQK